MSSSCLKTLLAYRADLVDIYKHAIEAVKPDQLVKNAIKFKDQTVLVRGQTGCSSATKASYINYDLRNLNLHVVGGGKCVLEMARGLAEVASQAQLTDRFSHGCLSLPIGQQTEFEKDSKTQYLLDSIKVSCRFGAANNLPDENSVAGSKFLLDQIRQAAAKDETEKRHSLFIVLISGGGSACLTSPEHVSLSEKLSITRQLVQSGADIIELNNVRRCLSSIKAGQLARHILESNPNSQIISLILSDTIGDSIESIASGPTHFNDRNDNWKTMLDVLKKYDLLRSYAHLFEKSHERLVEPKVSSIVQNIVIANNSTALEGAITRAKQLGYDTENLRSGLSGPTEVIVDTLLRKVDNLSSTSDRLLIVGGGEGTVKKNQGETWGLGGRVQEMALDYLILKMNEKSINTSSELDYFLAGSTDGQDGPTDVAACLASYSEWKIVRHEPTSSKLITSLEDIKLAKSSHDSYNFWIRQRPEWLVKTGLTGTNVMDIFLYLLSNKEDRGFNKERGYSTF